MNKEIKIAIHRREKSFSDYWIDWCENNNVNFKIVDAYESNIINEISDCDGFMWHWHQDSYADQLFARQLTLAITGMGVKVFPDVNTSWHFDDKLGQKYLFESLGIPHIKTFVFYEKDKAKDWINHATYPLVFKLRGGAGSNNVKKVRNKREAKYLVNKAFGSGFPVVDVYEVAWQALWEYRRDKKFIKLLRFGYYFIRAIVGLKPKSMSLRERQKGYIYVQDFMPNNTYDDRMVVVGKRCFCIRRMCRKNDFRASGSGIKIYDHSVFPKESIALAFLVAKKIGTQSIAMDLVYDKNGKPRVVEISYCFVTDKFNGYFNEKLEWVNARVTPQIFMIEDFMAAIEQKEYFKTAVC
ncbi:MAG TPA: hypothetical protein ENK99_04430 [Campylobacterales bacterium]|nr:hypothetical protein [Campylobacterales bacterium]